MPSRSNRNAIQSAHASIHSSSELPMPCPDPVLMRYTSASDAVARKAAANLRECIG